MPRGLRLAVAALCRLFGHSTQDPRKLYTNEQIRLETPLNFFVVFHHPNFGLTTTVFATFWRIYFQRLDLKLSIFKFVRDVDISDSPITDSP